jgi:HSP90 family molecular chaperone
MIQTDERGTISSTVHTQGFSVEMNSTLFDMLSSKVYTDKVLAVIREWSTNAIDACIEANKPIKYQIHLPTMLETFFSIRDYGTGLSKEDVIGLYSTVGASTKRDYNDFNGVFGIGRISGLAYSDSFTVTSFYDGVKSAYLVTSNQGIPTMAHLGDTKTKEENGLELKINVLPADIKEFSKKSS